MALCCWMAEYGTVQPGTKGSPTWPAASAGNSRAPSRSAAPRIMMPGSLANQDLRRVCISLLLLLVLHRSLHRPLWYQVTLLGQLIARDTARGLGSRRSISTVIVGPFTFLVFGGRLGGWGGCRGWHGCRRRDGCRGWHGCRRWDGCRGWSRRLGPFGLRPSVLHLVARIFRLRVRPGGDGQLLARFDPLASRHEHDLVGFGFGVRGVFEGDCVRPRSHVLRGLLVRVRFQDHCSGFRRIDVLQLGGHVAALLHRIATERLDSRLSALIGRRRGRRLGSVGLCRTFLFLIDRIFQLRHQPVEQSFGEAQYEGGAQGGGAVRIEPRNLDDISQDL